MSAALELEIDTLNLALQATSAQLVLDIPKFAHQAGIAKAQVKD